MLEEHTMVQAARNLSEKILKGCKGAVVFVYDDPRLAYEVEFVDGEEHTIELLTVMPSDIERI